MARTITVIWIDRYCDGGDSDFHIQELHLDLTPNEVRETPINDLIRMAMGRCFFGIVDKDNISHKLELDEAMNGYSLVGIINGVVEWLH